MSEVTEFDKELGRALDMVMEGWSDYASAIEAKEGAKQYIKQAVEKYIIGEHETIIDLANPAYTVGRNVVRQEQRQTLWGNKK